MTQPLTDQRSRNDLIAELYDRHATGLFAYCADQLGDPASAGYALVAVLSSVPAQAPPRAALYALARREIHRRDIVYAPPAVDPLVDPASALVERTLRELRQHQREVLLLCEVCGLTRTELAWVLDVAPDTAEELAISAAHRFRQTLSTALASTGARVPTSVADVYGALSVAPLRDILCRLPWPAPPAVLRVHVAGSRTATAAPLFVKPLWPAPPRWPQPLAESDPRTATGIFPTELLTPPTGRADHEATTAPMPRLRDPLTGPPPLLGGYPTRDRPSTSPTAFPVAFSVGDVLGGSSTRDVLGGSSTRDQPGVSPARDVPGGSPTRNPQAGSPARPFTAYPVSDPLAGTPLAGNRTRDPLTGNRTHDPLTGNRADDPLAGNRARDPLAGSPRQDPQGEAPVRGPFTAAPTRDPSAGAPPTDAFTSARDPFAPFTGAPAHEEPSNADADEPGWRAGLPPRPRVRDGLPPRTGFLLSAPVPADVLDDPPTDIMPPLDLPSPGDVLVHSSRTDTPTGLPEANQGPADAFSAFRPSPRTNRPANEPVYRLPMPSDILAASDPAHLDQADEDPQDAAQADQTDQDAWNAWEALTATHPWAQEGTASPETAAEFSWGRGDRPARGDHPLDGRKAPGGDGRVQGRPRLAASRQNMGGKQTTGPRKPSRTTGPAAKKQARKRKQRKHRDWAWEVAGFLICVLIAMLVFFAVPVIGSP
ncbi:RNA polymerase sigma factor [Nonomuraea endophytica]|uniref:DNA-directed RNA polymerase specialized sigma24 family protein n=1 Tax=Nonomuraea endophytica TaxID=714136 RepID=A0A7W8AD57_9ACTN|nr:sigma-70 family RNA polymerase sigma factor [Nonomuraea endophytica]MBB5083509.1 DNA-directed RNA polymerase specialized sigma24 family protein [Nonomuraea endophytica]